jgi:hypothetical protein
MCEAQSGRRSTKNITFTSAIGAEREILESLPNREFVALVASTPSGRMHAEPHRSPVAIKTAAALRSQLLEVGVQRSLLPVAIRTAAALRS